MTYPPAPWRLHGQLWLSLFRVRQGDHADCGPGIYAAALVSYEHPSPLIYSELLVARRVRAAGAPRINITDIWVDSEASMRGGRELWAIPKELCALSRTSTGHHLTRTSWDARVGGVEIASARFTDISRVSPRTPFAGSTWQRRRPDQPGTEREVVADLTGSGKGLPCRGSWTFNAAGPLGWLAGKRPLASFRMTDFQMSFG